MNSSRPLKLRKVSAKATPGGQVTYSPLVRSVRSPTTVAKTGKDRMTSRPSSDAAKPLTMCCVASTVNNRPRVVSSTSAKDGRPAPRHARICCALKAITSAAVRTVAPRTFSTDWSSIRAHASPAASQSSTGAPVTRSMGSSQCHSSSTAFLAAVTSVLRAGDPRPALDGDPKSASLMDPPAPRGGV